MEQGRSRKFFLLLVLCVAGTLASSCMARHLRLNDFVWVDDFDSFFGWQWKEVRHRGRTRYRKVRAGDISSRVLEAVSQGASSELERKVQVDPAQFPILAWSWKVMNVIEGADPDGLEPRDFPARVRVTFAPREARGRERTIEYVWASRAPRLVILDQSGGDRNTVLLPLESGRESLGAWRAEARHVLRDYVAVFGETPGEVRKLSVMTDTDDTGAQATAFYDDFRFLRQAGNEIPLIQSQPSGTGPEEST